MTKYRHSEKTKKPTGVKQKLSHLLHIIFGYCLISALLFNFVGLFSFFPDAFGINSAYHCYIIYCINTLLWSSNKTFLTYSYFLRLDTTFYATRFQINKWLLNIFYIVATLNFLGYIITLILQTKVSAFTLNEEYGFCDSISNTEVSTWAIIASIFIILYELFLSIWTLILFLKPLCHLQQLESDESLHKLIVKIGILNSIMIISSVLGFFLWAMTVANAILFIDNVINSLCLILMSKIHSRLYEKFCYLCIACKCCKYNANGQCQDEQCAETTV